MAVTKIVFSLFFWERAANQKHQTVMFVTWRCQRLGNISRLGQINPSKVLSMEGNMIDALFNVAVFATLGLSIVAFSAWAHKRVDVPCDQQGPQTRGDNLGRAPSKLLGVPF
jgi:hypothetical protein